MGNCRQWIAVEKLETNTYDIILMDLQMPIMNGLKLQNTSAIQWIYKSDYHLLQMLLPLIEKCKSIGMNDYISKPLDEKLLYTKILDVLKS
jgi:CheY-like chemotaxis protein